MNYYLEHEVDITFDFDYRSLYEWIADTCLDFFSCPYECEVNLLITNNRGIKKINHEQRGINSATDVLSFPNLTFKRAGDFSDITDDLLFEPDSGRLMLGDIVLSYDKIASQAREYGHSQKREYAFLIVHSMLHLLGFDHIEEDDRLAMEQKQKEIMEELKILR